ncbi:MAG: hypothetical protein A2Z20_11960 [Bdellovibrionales bacterium RBG_16_40_8]|nr:MAG: hypothetical protein A2Z20_11960 [Bdellovibrionales bacterium RBG_16_40_8]
MSGRVRDLSLLFTKVSGRKIAVTLFYEEATCLAHMSLIVVERASSSAQAHELFLRSEYNSMIADLKSQNPDYVNRNPQSPVNFASSTKKKENDQVARLWAGFNR